MAVEEAEGGKFILDDGRITLKVEEVEIEIILREGAFEIVGIVGNKIDLLFVVEMVELVDDR